MSIVYDTFIYNLVKFFYIHEVLQTSGNLVELYQISISVLPYNISN